MCDWQLINTIEEHILYPEKIPGSSWFVVYTNDIRTLIQAFRELLYKYERLQNASFKTKKANDEF